MAVSNRRVALVHYWLVGMRGGERVLEVLCELYPEADIFTHVCDESTISDTIKRHQIHTTFISRLPFAKKLYQLYLPLMPRALEELDLTDYDLVISSESGPAKGVVVAPDALHVCYCHSPMRYLWDHYPLYKRSVPVVKKLIMQLFFHRLRVWDVTSSSRVDKFIANSAFVSRRIEKYWRRESVVIHPPVSTEQFSPCAMENLGDYYLWVGELVSYKRADLMIEAFKKLGLPLVVIGGPSSAAEKFKKEGLINVEFLDRVDLETLKQYMSRCRALIFPGEEDFGIVPLEIMASGRPVIAYGKGGALETVVDGVTGMFFWEQTVDSLVAAVQKFEDSDLKSHSPVPCVNRAAKFSRERFKVEMKQQIALAKRNQDDKWINIRNC